MTDRDRIAEQAMLGILCSRHGFMVDCGTENVATWAYRIADNMLAERCKPKPADEIDDAGHIDLSEESTLTSTR